MPSLAFVGTMAAGKTTLAMAVASKVGSDKAVVLEETARLLMNENKAPNAQELTAMINDARSRDYLSWQTLIADRQDEIEENVGFAEDGDR